MCIRDRVVRWRLILVGRRLHVVLDWCHVGWRNLPIVRVDSILAVGARVVGFTLGVLLLIHFFDGSKVLVLLVLEVGLLRLFDVLVHAVDFKLVGGDLGLVVLELENHLFELLGALFQVLLVNGELFVHFRTALLR